MTDNEKIDRRWTEKLTRSPKRTNQVSKPQPLSGVEKVKGLPWKEEEASPPLLPSPPSFLFVLIERWESGTGWKRRHQRTGRIDKKNQGDANASAARLQTLLRGGKGKSEKDGRQAGEELVVLEREESRVSD